MLPRSDQDRQPQVRLFTRDSSVLYLQMRSESVFNPSKHQPPPPNCAPDRLRVLIFSQLYFRLANYRNVRTAWERWKFELWSCFGFMFQYSDRRKTGWTNSPGMHRHSFWNTNVFYRMGLFSICRTIKQHTLSSNTGTLTENWLRVACSKRLDFVDYFWTKN